MPVPTRLPKEDEPPILPPPVQPPEFFPGFGAELQQLGIEQYKAQTAIAKAERVRVQAQQRVGLRNVPGLLPSIGRSIQEFMLGGVVGAEARISTAALEQERQLAQMEYDLALQDLKSSLWRQEIMVSMPNYLSLPDYKIQSAEDILQYLPLDSMREEDTVWLNSIYDRLKHLSNVLPEGFDGDAIEAQSKVLDEILTSPKLELRAVHNLTVEEIAKSFAFGVSELPEGMTEEDVRSMLGRMDLEEEEMKSAKTWLAERALSWRIETSRLNLIRSGTVLVEAPSLTPIEFGKLLLTQPMMATVYELDKYFNMLPRPLAASAIIGFHELFNTPDATAAGRLEDNFNFFRSMGESRWDSYAMAFNDWDAPWWMKLTTEIFFDPVSYIGLGMATSAANTIGKGLTRVGLRSVGTRIGPWVEAFENGYVAGADAVFRAGVKGILAPIKGTFWLTGAGYTIPKTFTTMARGFARDSYMKLSSVLQRTYPEVRNLKGLTAKDAIDTGTNAIDQALARPMEGADAAVRAGAPMLEFDYLDEAAAIKMYQGVVKPKARAGVVWDDSRLAHFNNEVLNMFSGQGERITAGMMIADLGQEATEAMVEKLSAKLIAFRQRVADTAKASLKGDTATEVLMGQFNRLESIRYANLHSPMTKYMQQAGRSASWHSRVADRVLYASQLVALERRAVMPLAKLNLLFLNFGPFNFGENSMRSFLGGGELLYPKAYSGVSETNRLFKGLANAPYELQLFERGEARLAQAMVDPKTGSSAIFKGGKIPFVTRNVVIPEKVPFLGGKTIGAKINIGGKDFPLASFQDGYDMWAHFNSMQVAYDYQVHFMKALADIAPDDMRAIKNAINSGKSILDNISAIHPQDARDIERVLMQDAVGGGPEAVRAHQMIDVLEFERRQISKELYKTLDKMTEVRSITKQGIRDEVLDGSIFSDIDGRIAAFVEQERELSLVSLKNQMDVLTTEADAFLANPPRNLDEFLGDMQNITSMVEGTGERIHDYRKLTELRKAKLLPGEMDDFEVGSAKLLAEFMETSEVQLNRIMNQLVENARVVPTISIPGEVSTLADSMLPGAKVSISSGRNFSYTPSSKTVNVPQAMLDAVAERPIEGAASLRYYTAHELAHAQFDATGRKFASRPLEEEAAHKIAAEVTGVNRQDAISFLNEVTMGRLPVRPAISEAPILSDIQLARLTDFDSVSRLELENILSTRNKVAQIESIIPRTAKKARNDRFWTQQRAQKAAIWDEFETNARKFKSLRLRASRSFLNSVDKPVFTPDFIPEVVTELSPNHLAYLFGATGDDLYRGLTRVQHNITIRPREDFILHTVEQADAYAAKLGKNASDIGFTEDAIGDVYDQLWHNLGIEPTILTPDSPTVMQLEEIRQELTRMHGAYKLPSTIESAIQRVDRLTAERAYKRGITGKLRGADFEEEIRLVTSGDKPVWWNEFQVSRALEGFEVVPYREGSVMVKAGNIEAADEFIRVKDQLDSDLMAGRLKGTEYEDRLGRALGYTENDIKYFHLRNEIIAEIDKDLKVLKTGKSYEDISDDDYAKVMKKAVSDDYDAVQFTSTSGEVHVNIESLRGSKAPDVIKYRQYINGVADEVDKLPIYKAALLNLKEEIHPTGATILRDYDKAGEATGNFVQYRITKNTMKIEGINVSEEFRRKGLGTELYIEALSRAKAKNLVVRIDLATDEGAAIVKSLVDKGIITIDKAPVKMAEVRVTSIQIPDKKVTGAVEWFTNKESAMTKAREMHSLAYPTYDDANIIDESMRAIFPFWNYELFRWRWIPRTWMRTPGTMTGLAKYVENTDQGYLPVPGTDLQINMLRGSVWMGGLRSFYLRDFPEYYDAVPGMEFIDYIGRAGFFPGVHVMAPIVLFGAVTGKPEWAQLAPAWVRTTLSGLRALSPQHIGAVLEHIYPDRFRDYMTMLTLGEEGYDADEIWRKIQNKETLTPEEDKLWLDAVNRVDGIKGILMQQTGLFRIRPEEFTEIRREMRLAIEEATGVPVAVQEQIDQQYPVTGKRFSDYYKLDVQQQKLLYEWETYRRWQGVTTPLYPSSWQAEDIKRTEYYQEVERIYNEARTVGVYEDGELIRPSQVEMNRQWVEGEIGPDQWISFNNDLAGNLAEAVRVLGESPAYKDVPKTFEEMATRLEERNIPTAVQSPDQELLYYYYELKPEYKWNWESQRNERDYDTYYAYIDILLESLDSAHRERLLQRIQADWTPLKKLHWQTSREFMRPYRNLRSIVLNEYSPEEVQQIRRYEVASASERDALRELPGPEGDKLISSYQRRLREARQRLRILDPEMDAWLNFFGTTTSLLSTQAEELYEELRKKYLVPEMIR